MPAKSQLNRQDLQQLQQSSNLLHLFHHRNHNQHRRSIWWRHFSLLRQQLARLIDELHQALDEPATHVARARKKARAPALQARIDQRLALWQNVLVARWQRAFSQLVADGRFAVLGLVLVATMAEVCRIVKLTEVVANLTERDSSSIIEHFAHEVPPQPAVLDSEDVGEALDRNVVPPDIDAAADPKEAISSANDAAKKIKKHKSKKKKGNAIDDIFGD